MDCPCHNKSETTCPCKTIKVIEIPEEEVAMIEKTIGVITGTITEQ